MSIICKLIGHRFKPEDTHGYHYYPIDGAICTKCGYVFEMVGQA